MEQENKGDKPGASAAKRAAGSFGAFMIAFLFVWLVFDNLALAFLFALMAGGGSEVAQRAAGRKPN